MRKIVLVTDAYMAVARPKPLKNCASSSNVYVSDMLALQQSIELRELSNTEMALGDRRWLEYGVDAKVDQLYDQLNRCIITVKSIIALNAVRQLPGCANIEGQFSPYAGCPCSCSSGIVLSHPIYFEINEVNYQVDIWVKQLVGTSKMSRS